MRLSFGRRVAVIVCLTACLTPTVGWGAAPPLETASAIVETLQAPGATQPPWTRGGRRRTRDDSTNQKNHATVKDIFRDTAKQAAAATVTILSAGEPVALGTVVDPDGYIVTKASLLGNDPVCRLADGTELDARVVGTAEAHDLALLRVEALGLATAPWRTGDTPSPGSIVAAVAPPDELMAIGIVSAEPRKIDGETETKTPRAWLGIGLGSSDADLTIVSVDRASAASAAGLKVGDRINSIDGTAMRSAGHVIQAIASRSVGAQVALIVSRGDEEIEVTATLGKRYAGQTNRDHWGGGPFSRRREGFPTALAHDIAVHPDNCGGPLIDTDGRVVGVNIARALRVTTYALPAAVVKQVVTELRAAEAIPTSAE